MFFWSRRVFSRVLFDFTPSYVGPSVGWSVGWLVPFWTAAFLLLLLLLLRTPPQILVSSIGEQVPNFILRQFVNSYYPGYRFLLVNAVTIDYG